MARIDAFLEIMAKSGASDLHISANCPPMLRINGALEHANHRPFTEEEVKLLTYEVLSEQQIQAFEADGELDCAYAVPGVARFRINIYKKYPGIAAAFRVIPHSIPTLDELKHPETLKRMLDHRSGLILVTGPTSSGKSTTLAAMVDYLNENKNYHILTLEDPLEFIHTNKNCLVNQRQIGTHSRTFANALRAALREDPNVILVGEMRDLETISLAVTAAEMGQLVLATLHTKSAAQTISRVVDVFPVDQQPQVRLTLSEVLVGIVAQLLLRRTDNRGRVAVMEILVGTHAIRNLIREGKGHQVPNIMQTGQREGMRLLDNELKRLVEQGIVTREEAIRSANDPQAMADLTNKLKAPGRVPAKIR